MDTKTVECELLETVGGFLCGRRRIGGGRGRYTLYLTLFDRAEVG